jgi:ribonuclease P protein component
VLARANRLTTASDYRTTIRRGRRIVGSLFIVSALRGSSGPARFGFVIGRKVGNAPERNHLRRQLKALSYSMLGEVPAGSSIVVRALPGSAQADWQSIGAEFRSALTKAGM